MDILTVDQIKKALENPDLTKGGLADAMKVPPSAVSSLLKGERELKVSEVPDIVNYLRLDQVKVVGRVGAGGDIDPFFEQMPPEGWDTVQIPFLVDPDMVALRIHGDSMPGKYDDGDIIVVWKTQKLPIEAFYGDEAAVLTADGRRLLKRIEPGAKKNTVDLHSYDGRKPIVGVKPIWIGEVYLTLKKSQLARMHIRSQGTKKRGPVRR